jgi:hypothetical protein
MKRQRLVDGFWSSSPPPDPHVWPVGCPIQDDWVRWRCPECNWGILFRYAEHELPDGLAWEFERAIERHEWYGHEIRCVHPLDQFQIGELTEAEGEAFMAALASL